MREIRVTICRNQPGSGDFRQEYHVPAEEDEILSVMNVLEYIYQYIDGSLAFFSHAACKQAACGKCLVKINGKVVLACKEKADDESFELAPYNTKVLCDLICDD